MPRAYNVERTPFGTLLKHIRRERCHASQEDFASMLHQSRSLIGSLETKGIPKRDFVEHLIEQFPDLTSEIVSAARATHEKRPPKPPTQADALKLIDNLLETGQYRAAYARIQSQLCDAPDDRTNFALQRRIARLCITQGAYEDARNALVNAIGLGEWGSIPENEMCSAWTALIAILQKVDLELAHRAIQDALLSHPTASTIWHIKGTLHFVEQEYTNAYAALSIALQYGKPSPDVLVTRGCVLTEWGQYQAAVRDLERALTAPSSEISLLAEAHAALAFSQFRLGDEQQARNSFLENEHLVISGYACYLWGLFEALTGQSYAPMRLEEALLGEIAISETGLLDFSLALGTKRRNAAIRWIEDLRAERPLRALDSRVSYKVARLVLDPDKKM